MKVTIVHNEENLGEFDSVVRARKWAEQWVRLDVEAFGWADPYHIYRNGREIEHYLATYDEVPQIKHIKMCR